ncbi:MAG: type II CAAX prenyl endopeptidase Rce1 family protein [Phycisphaerae bacterium]
MKSTQTAADSSGSARLLTGWLNIKPLHAWSPSPAVRFLLFAEVALFLGVIAAYMHFALPTGGQVRFVHVATFIFAGVFPIAMNLLHGDRPRDSGIRLDNLLKSFKEVGAATAGMAAGVIVTAAILGSFHWDEPLDVAEHFGGYLGWALVQQYWIHAFVVRRLRQAGVGRRMVVVLSAVLFGLMHAPNWPLALLTGGAALAWIELFLHTPNIFPMVVSHAFLAVLVRYSLPYSWMHRLTVGGIYLRELANGG